MPVTLNPLARQEKDTAPNTGSGSCPRKGKYDVEQRRKYDVKKSNMVLEKGNVMLNKGGSGLGCTSIKCTPELAKPS